MKFWENGSRPLEIVTSQQWFIRYPPKDEMLARGKELAWWPDFMRVRFENWVNGLIGDWNITRQRFFGVPFPVWYPIDDDGVTDFLSPILADESALPIDPTTTVPPGYEEAQRNQPGGFAADPDVMDTWATSSLTAQIVCGWEDDPDLFARTFPMDLRPQAHEIIRTWLFSSVVRSHYEHDCLPWANAAISGFVYDPDRKKLSKSAGNSPNEPMAMLAQHGADGVRYWAANGRPGMDLAVDEGQMKIGRRLAIKVLNASKFALGFGSSIRRGHPAARPGDARRAGPPRRRGHGRVRPLRLRPRHSSAPRRWFWSFCDDYLELVKNRAYGDGPEAGVGAGAAHARPRDAAQAVRPLPALRHRRGLVVVAGGQHPPLVLAGGRAAAQGGRRRRRAPAARGRRRSSPRSAGPSPRPSDRCAHRVDRVVVTDTAERLAALELVAADLREAGVIAELVAEVGETVRRRGRARAGGLARARSGRLVGEGVEVVLARLTGRAGSRRTHTVRWAVGISIPATSSACLIRTRSSRSTLNCSAGRVFTTRRIVTPSAASSSTPHTSGSSSTFPAHVGSRHSSSATRLISACAQVEVGAVRHRDVEHRAGPLLAHVADPEHGAVRHVPDRAVHRAELGRAQ